MPSQSDFSVLVQNLAAILMAMAAVIGAVGGIVAAVLGYLNRQAIAKAATDNEKDKKVLADGVAQVKVDLLESNEKQTEKLNDIHEKVNGAITAPLRLAAEACRAAAEAKPSAEAHAKAEAAEDALSNHLADQEASKSKPSDWKANKANGPT